LISVDSIRGKPCPNPEAIMSTTEQPDDFDSEFEQLKLLFDYTKFHIGLYTTIATIFGGLFAASDKAPISFSPTLLFCSVIFICLAGVGGGVIASSIPAYRSYRTFWDSRIGPFWFRGMKAEYWTYLEHGAFWAAVVLAILSIIFPHAFDRLPQGRGYS
jgi:hypothetical protein